MKEKHPLLLYCNEIQTITGRTARYAQNLITEIWKLKNKPKQRWVSVHDLSEYLGIPKEDIYSMLGYAPT